ncbi:MAG TPA: TIGR04086 family membrane protein [Firmicutes bacterium]|jgi:hydroxylaminobenzene mutase|nr:TIGR04086 family membrane protein [Bacillota bacterium]
MKKSSRMQTDVGLVFSLKVLIKAVLLALAVYIILAFLVTVVINFRSELEVKLPTLAYVAQYLTVFVTGIAAGRAAEQSGWLHGLGAGMVFAIIVLVVGSFLLPVKSPVAGRVLWQVLPAALLGMGGGAVGANL